MKNKFKVNEVVKSYSDMRKKLIIISIEVRLGRFVYYNCKRITNREDYVFNRLYKEIELIKLTFSDKIK